MPLRVVDAELLHGAQLGGAVHLARDGAHVERVGHVHEAVDQRTRDDVVVRARHERTVDLQQIGIHLAQEAEAARARAGVVHRDLTTTFDERARERREFLRRDAGVQLGDFEAQRV